MDHTHVPSASMAPGKQKLTYSPGRQSNTHVTNSWEVNYEIRLVRLRRSNPYDKKNIKIKFNSDGELPTNKAIEISSVTKSVRAVFL